MNLRSVNASLLAGFLVVLALAFAITKDPFRPNREFVRDMRRSAAFGTFEANPFLPNGMTLQPPPPGTISRGALPLDYAPSAEDAVRAGEELTNPYAPTDSLEAARGAFLFYTFCQCCHGPEAGGDGPVARRGYPAPPPLYGESAVSMKDGHIFHLITYGRGNMSGYAAQIDADDRWKVVLHVRALQKRHLVDAAEALGGRPRP